MEEIKSAEVIPSKNTLDEKTQSEKKSLGLRPAAKPKPEEMPRVRRVSFEISTKSGHVSKGRLFVSYSMTHEFSPLGVRFFCNDEFVAGQDIQISLYNGTKSLALTARVVWCKSVDINPKIISENAFRYRLEAMFVSADSQSREQLMDYSKQIFEHYLG
jgi:hypothetical protein